MVQKSTGRRACIGFLAAITTCVAISGCSSVGPGLKNHPGDCAIGIPWADCLPGTAGYNNGGGKVHRDEAKAQSDAITASFAAAGEQCKTELSTPELDPIRNKVQLFRPTLDEPVPFQFAANDNFPSADDLPVIAKWAAIRDACIQRSNAISNIPPNATAMQVTYLQKSRSFSRQTGERVGELIVALYRQKLTYGEFAQKRYEIGRDAAAAELSYRQAMLESDAQRQIQAQQIAEQNFANRLNAWSAYMQAVNARQPLTVHVDGTVRVQ